jgi:hypothetical protein
MAYTDQKQTNTDMRRVAIREVNMEANYVTAEDAFGASFQISVDFHAPVVAIPVPGEMWLISKRGHDYYLERKLESGEEELSIESLQPGDRRILTTGTIYLEGTDVRINGQTIGEIVDPRFEEIEADLAQLEADLPVLIDEPTIVRTNTNQTVSGIKTFTNGILIGNSTINLVRITDDRLGTSDVFRVYGNSGADRYIEFTDQTMTFGGSAGPSGANLYLSAADTLKTDDAFVVGTTLSVGTTINAGTFIRSWPAGSANTVVLGTTDGGSTSAPAITFGSAADTNIYRFTANVLMSDDVIGSLNGGRHTYIGSAYTVGNGWIGGYFGGSLRWDGTNWQNENAGGNNGWAMIGVNGASGGLDIYTEASTGASNRSYTDAQMITKKVISVTPAGRLDVGNVGITIGDTAMSRTAANELEMASGDIFKVSAAGLKFNNGSVKTTGGSVVTTSLVGLTEYDGAQAWLKYGGSRKHFWFDATLGRWVSDSWIAAANEDYISHNTTVSTVGTQPFPVCSDYNELYSAGAHLQVRVMWMWWNGSSSNGEFDAVLYSGGDAGGYYANQSTTLISSYNTGPGTGTPIWSHGCDIGDNTWRDIGSALSSYSQVSGYFGLRSNAAPNNTITWANNMHFICRLVSD